jgi:hypothetical protein
MFVDVNQCKRIIRAYLDHTGRGGFLTGTVSSTAPLKIRINDKLELDADDFYVTDSCIGLQQGNVIYRPPLRAGEGVLLLCRPAGGDGVKYILLDRIQPYKAVREAST